jgi:hypothetical protein
MGWASLDETSLDLPYAGPITFLSNLGYGTMATDFEDPRPVRPSLVRGGPSYHLARGLGLEPPTPPRRLRKIVLLVLVTWVPLVLLSFLQGQRVALPLLLDPVIYSRFLVVVPLLELAQIVVETSLAVQMRHFLDSGLVPERERPRFESAQDAVIRLRGSVVVEAVIAALSVIIPVVSRVVVKLGMGDSSWERLGTTITTAGWWYILVSLPILYFLLLRWVWVFLLWAAFLFRVSRLDLELTPTHPDRAGGLGFLGWGLASFAIVLLAVSAVLSGSFAGEILFRGSSLDRLKYHVIIFVGLAIVILHAPLLAFTGRLGRCRFQALLDFGTLSGCHDRAFDEKWVKPQGINRESLLGNPDVSSLADIAIAFEHVERMKLIPWDKKALIVLVLAALVPMIPLVGTAIPLTEILAKLGEFMV